MGIATVSIRNSLVCQDKLRSLQCHNIVERQFSDFLRQLILFVGQGFDINLELDNVRKAQIALYDRAANQLTRGTWTGAEVAGHGLTGVGSGASTITSSECVSDKCHEPRRSDLMHTQGKRLSYFLLSVWKGFVWSRACAGTLPAQFKQLMVYDHPLTKELWLGRAIPRDWLAPGEQVRHQSLSVFIYVCLFPSMRVPLFPRVFCYREPETKCLRLFRVGWVTDGWAGEAAGCPHTWWSHRPPHYWRFSRTLRS